MEQGVAVRRLGPPAHHGRGAALGQQAALGRQAVPLVWVLRPTAGSLFLAALSKCLTDPCAGCLARRGAPESRLSAAACPKQKAASAPREPRAPRPPAAM